ncbi:TonB-dependent receptor plug domain-containing protein [Pontibacter sp. JH31]|uniref:TonB-dependent receptor plug domain-containing protein n=1 Tax=Pontibacter aquaedesilientis TaxID=2766980 RepID=A0ABR7XG16_9BACT|nr:TonB-dependent receptor [Pontibacter aquaedesilientis]MBD1397209.1 TonB-dependent receptor plug domain-containing protein [Pontibacter aquaedesilientis]
MTLLIRYFLIIILLLFPLLSHAQEQITGQVLDAQTRQGLEGVTVTANTGEQALTNATGRFALDLTNRASFLLISHIGYKPDTVFSLNVQQGMAHQVYLQPLTTSLSEVIVTGYESNRPLLETAGALSVIDREVIQRFDESSLVRAVNTVPGVRMEERATASYRLSIRGSSLRSPYGIRNVKVYLGEIPLTESNGITNLNLLDAANFSRMEILKGPTGSIYGAGTGGTVLLEPRRANAGEKTFQVGSTVGSFGLRRYTTSASVGSEKQSLYLQYTRQQLDGYREQSAMDRETLLLTSTFNPSEKNTIRANLIYSDLFYELPGGLTAEQYGQDPSQARGGRFGSVAQNASMNQKGVNIGLSQEYRFSDSWKNTTALYGLFRYRDHPFNTDYERNTNQEYGARSRFVYNTSLGNVATTLTFGGEYQRGFEAARTYDNNQGITGALRTDDEVLAKTGLLFTQTEFELPGNWIATAALSLNNTKYEITRLHQAPTGSPYQFTRDFSAVLSPRVALLKRLSEQVSVHGSVSAGFSPPSEEELLTSDGALNKELEAEKGINYEAGVRGYTLGRKLSFDVVAFHLRLRETIVSRQDLSSIAVFRNVGATSQSGLETAVGYTIIEHASQPVSLLKVWGSYTYSHFRFRDYQKNETDLTGNKLTGVAPHTLTTGLDLATRFGLYLHLTANYMDEVPLTDENTVYAEAYLVAGARLGLKRELGQHFLLDIFTGAENLSDQQYSLGNDLNAFGGRYFQPASPRNYYGGFSLAYRL